MKKFGFFITMLLASSLFFSGCGGGGSSSGSSDGGDIIVPESPEVPIITLNGDNPQNVVLNRDYIEAGATATDDIDGDITAKIVIDASAVNTSVVGNYDVTYNVTDSSGNAAQEVTRVVTVVPEAELPVITLNGDNPQLVDFNGTYIEAGATATDNIDGDITANIVIDASDVNTGEIGNYRVTYNVTDSSGYAADEVIRIVAVRYDISDIPQPPTPEINGTTLACDDVDTTMSTDAELFVPSPTIKRNVSSFDDNSTRVHPTALNSLERMEILVDATDANGTVLVPTAKVYPLVITYTQQVFGAYEASEGEADIGDPTVADGVYMSVSLDDGLTWKKYTIADFTDLSSRNVMWGEDNNVSYPGHSHKASVAIEGDKILMTFNSKYCEENPHNLAKNTGQQLGYIDDYFGVNGEKGSQGDVIDPGQGSYQGSINYEGIEAPNGKIVWEVPFSCVWTARGSMEANGSVTMQAPVQLTSGTRDTNHVAIASDEVGFALAWQEDTEGMHAGEGSGPGEGWSGATANHGSDIWYTSIKMTEFDTAENFLYPVRITDNEKCGPDDKDGYCQFLCDTYESVEIPQGGGSPNDDWVERCLTYDFDMLEDIQTFTNGDTGASRAQMEILTTDLGEKVVILGYEETKGLSIDNTTPDAETDIELEGKAVYFESFLFDAIDAFDRTKPDTILDVAMPLVSAGNIVNVKAPQENNETHLIYENARRITLGTQEDGCEADQFTFAYMYKQSFDTKGESSDMFIRVNNGFTWDSFVPLNTLETTNVSAQTSKIVEFEDYIDPNYDNGWTTANLEDYTYENKEENTFSPRVFLRGNIIYVGFEYTPNYKQGKKDRFPNDFHHNIFDGTVWKGPKNVTQIQTRTTTSVDARFFATPAGVNDSDITRENSDENNKDLLFVTWGTVQADDITDLNSTISEGDILGRRSTDMGDTYENEFVIAGEKTGDATAVHEKEVSTLVTPDGKTLYNVWLQETDTYDAADPMSGLDSWFGRVDFNISK